MASRSPDLHGNIPDSSNTALVLIDVINDLEFKGGNRLLKSGELKATKLAQMKCAGERGPYSTVYVNDNFGRWTSYFR
jgi:hypothetical protein